MFFVSLGAVIGYNVGLAIQVQPWITGIYYQPYLLINNKSRKQNGES